MANDGFKSPTMTNGLATKPSDISHVSPPPISQPYTQNMALDDLQPVVYALELFLTSYMVESEKYCEESDPAKERLYLSTGHGLVQTVKAFMTYADEDILSAIGHTKRGAHVAQQHRRKAGITSRVSGLTNTLTSAFTGGEGSDVAWIRGMTPVERHAELVYAESLSEKAMLGIVYSGDWMAFIKEALNMRTTITIYRSLYRFIQISDATWTASHPKETEDPSLDPHFRTGVYLGYGLSTLILSLLPSKLVSLVELFGYHASRAEALEVLGRAGGWGGKPADDDSSPPLIDKDHEGIRRPLCDIVLLSFHLVISSFTTVGVSMPTASRLIKYYTQRFPRGVFFLFARGRMALFQSRPADAIQLHQNALDILTQMESLPSGEGKKAHQQFARLAAISYWERAIAYLALCDVEGSLAEWKLLHISGGWSKAVYAYGYAICSWDVNRRKGEKGKKDVEKAIALLKTVPGLRQKFAGKSIPLEKLVARKARKFLTQGNNLVVPSLEMAYWFLAIARAPKGVLCQMLKDVDAALSKLESASASRSREGYWDDVALVRFLEGTCLRYIAYPDSDAFLSVSPTEADVTLSADEAARRAEASFKAVFDHGPKIEWDHHVVYHAHYELGRLYACQKRTKEAQEQFDLVLSGKYLEVGPSGRKGRYSLENALHMKTRAAAEVLAH